jgi:hypothetical protein
MLNLPRCIGHGGLQDQRFQIREVGQDMLALRHGPFNESDLRLVDDYRRSFAQVYEAVVRTIRQLGEFPTGRLAKSTDSIVGKLRRGTYQEC